MELVEFDSADAFVAFDIDGVPAAGGTRLAADVDRDEVALLARAMSYKLAVLEMRLGGAKAGIRAAPADRDRAVGAFRDAVGPLLESGRLRTGPDLGTRAADFAGLPGHRSTSPVQTCPGGATLDAYATGLGVVAAAETALGSLAGRSFAIEGFGNVGASVAIEAVARGARVVAVSTVAGCVIDERGLDVPALLDLRARHGDRWPAEAGHPVLPRHALFEQPVDVLVPGARIGVIDEATARRTSVALVAPAANVPYTRAGLDVLRQRGACALPDFVCNAGAVICLSARLRTRAELSLVDSRVSALTAAVLADGEPFAAAGARAEQFMAGWLRPDQMPPGPPLAPVTDAHVPSRGDPAASP